MLIHRKNPRVYCHAHQLRNIDFGGKRPRGISLLLSVPKVGKREGNNLIGRRTMPPLGAKPCDTGSNVIGCLATCSAVRRLHISTRARESTHTIILFLYNLPCCLESFCNRSHQKDKLIYLLFLYYNPCRLTLFCHTVNRKKHKFSIAIC